MTSRLTLLTLCTLTTVASAQPEDPAPAPDVRPAEPQPTPVEPPPTEAVTAKPVPIESAPEKVEPLPLSISTVAPWSAARIAFELELYTHARATQRDGDDLSELLVDRAELGSRVALGKQAAAEMRVEAIRSAPDGGALGIDGDSTVLRLRAAHVSGRHAFADKVLLEGAMGLVPDPWIQTVEQHYTVKALSRSASERLLGWQPADLSVLARATVGPVRATVQFGNGEGLRYPERNNGQTTTAVLEVIPIQKPDMQIRASGVVRDGSLGVALIRDRRFGGGLTALTPWVRGGLEVMIARGIGDRGEAEGTMFGGWADARVVDRVFVSARGATVRYADDAGTMTTAGGGVSYEAWREDVRADRVRGRVRLWLAVDRISVSGTAMPVLGADAVDATQIMLVASAVAPFVLE